MTTPQTAEDSKAQQPSEQRWDVSDISPEVEATLLEMPVLNLLAPEARRTVAQDLAGRVSAALRDPADTEESWFYWALRGQISKTILFGVFRTEHLDPVVDRIFEHVRNRQQGK